MALMGEFLEREAMYDADIQIRAILCSYIVQLDDADIQIRTILCS